MFRVRRGVIPAGGKGNRIGELPLTKILPKPMLPVLNRPILEYVVEKMKSLGVEKIYMIVGYMKEVIEKYFENGEDFGVEIQYIEEKESQLRGIASAIELTKELIKEPFITILGDDFTLADSLDNLMQVFFKKKAWAVEGIVSDNDVESLKRTNCVRLAEDGRILETIEKPKHPVTKYRGCGIYVFDPIVFQYIEKTPVSPIRNQKEITYTIHMMAQDGPVYGPLIKGTNININTLSDLIQAMNYALKLPRVKINV